MNKQLPTSLAALLSVSVMPLPVCASDESTWWKDPHQQHSYRADSTDSQIQAQIMLRDDREIEFILVINDQDYCAGKPENHIGFTRYLVNGELTYFKMNCYREAWLNLSPSSSETRINLLNTFADSGSANSVSFVQDTAKLSPSRFTLPTASFRGHYLSLMNEAD